MKTDRTSHRLSLHVSVGLALLAALVFASPSQAAPGDLDPSFGTGGKVITDINNLSSDVATAVAIQADGKIVVAGSSYNGNDSDFALVRYNPDGTLDTTFGTGGEVTTDINSDVDTATAVAIQPDGKIVVAGFLHSSGSTADFAVVRYNADGGLDSTFGTGGKITTDIDSSDNYATALVIQPDGKIVVAGFSPFFFALVRYSANGSLDPTFGTGGKVTTDFGSGTHSVTALSIQADGKLVAAGSSVNGNTSDFALARYNTDGTLDTTFGTGGKVTTAIGSKDDNGFALAIQGDGKLVVAGNSNNGSTVVFALARYNSDGSLDLNFGTTGTVTTDIDARPAFATAIAVQMDGRLVVGGSSFNGSNNDFVAVRYNTNGSLDASFGTGGKVTTDFGFDSDEARALAIQAGGKLVIVGNSTVGNSLDFAIARYLNGGPSSLNFGTVPVGSGNELTFTLANSSSSALTGSATTSAPFSIVGDPTFSVSTNQTKTITVRFSPTSIGPANGFVNFTTNGGNSSLPVTGTAIPVPTLGTFTVTDLGDLLGGADTSDAWAINNNGVVVGAGTGVCNGVSAVRPFIWTPSEGMRDLGPFPTLNSSGSILTACSGYATAVNDQGQVVGTLGYVAGERPFIWKSDVGMQLIDIGDRPGRALDINGSGEVVGFVGSIGGSAFVWNPNIGATFIGPGAVFSVPYAINEIGEIAGHVFIVGSQVGFWNLSRQFVPVNDIPFSFGSAALAINNSSHLVGRAFGDVTSPIFNENRNYAFFWSPTSGAVDLGELPLSNTRYSEATSINDTDQVVGNSNGGAFLWTPDKGIRDLNGLLDASGAGWSLISAKAINNAGQIVGFGLHNGVPRAFLLTPIPVTTPTPVLAVTPGSRNFSNVNVGTTKDLDFTVQNTGGGTLTGSANTRVPFSIVGENSFSLGPGQSKDIAVRFRPTLAGTANAFVNFTSNGGKVSLSVTGTGVILDTDGDGMPNGFELTHGLNPNDPVDAGIDSDGDGLANLKEFQLGTNPFSHDSDGDGFSDGRENLAGSNPLSTFSFPSPVILTRPALPVVFVHGICSGATTWNFTKTNLKDLDWVFGGTVEAFTDDLSTDTVDSDFYLVQFEDGLIRAGLGAWRNELALSLSRINAFRVRNGLPETKFVVVAHSAGGLAARAYLQSGNIFRGDIHHLITYGTPHLGTPVAGLSPDIALVCKDFDIFEVLTSQGINEMDPSENLPFLRDLNARSFPPEVQHTSIIGTSALCRPVLLRQSDCVVPSSSQNILNIPSPPNRTLVETRNTDKPHWLQTSDFSNILSAINKTGILEGEGETIRGVDRINVTVASPVDITVTDPSGRTIGKVFNEIPFASYDEIEDTPGHRLDLVTIPLAETGSYAINVIPETGALSSDTFTITAIVNEQSTSIADRVRVADIPKQGFSLSLLPENKNPTAIAGLYQTVRVGSPVMLDGTQSFDLDNGPGPLTFAWTKISGPTVALSGATTANPTFTPKLAGNYTFSLVVNDGQIDSAPDLVRVEVVTPKVINNLVSFAPISSTFKTTTSISGCPGGFAGTFSFNARLTDNGTSPSLSDLTTRVATLTNGNLLQNADGGPAGVGATLTVRKVGSFSDGVLGPGESVDIPFVLCLKTMARFSFFVDVLGIAGQNNLAGR